jgi:hypothetical protein
LAGRQQWGKSLVPAGLPLSDRLDTCVAVMTALALPFPSSFSADAERADLAVVLPGAALESRSRGPYSAERIPAEHDRMISRIELRWQGQFERPDVTVAVGGDWPELVMVLPLSQVFVRFLMPEGGVEGSASPWSLGLAMDVKTALGWVAALLRQAGEPPVRVDISYAADPSLEIQRAQLPPEAQAAFPPLVGIVGVDLRSCGRRERHAFDAAARAIVPADQQVDWHKGGGFTVPVGFARVSAAS